MHKEISNLKLYEYGGLVIHFEDNDHTFIPADIMKQITEYIIENIEWGEDD